MGWTPRLVVDGTVKHLELFIKAWLMSLPDISDLPHITPDMLSFWKKRRPKTRAAPQTMFKGLCAAWYNKSVDFAIGHNKWPVQFRDRDGTLTDLVPEFACTLWLRYCSQMVRVLGLVSYRHICVSYSIYVFSMTYMCSTVRKTRGEEQRVSVGPQIFTCEPKTPGQNLAEQNLLL